MRRPYQWSGEGWHIAKQQRSSSRQRRRDAVEEQCFPSKLRRNQYTELAKLDRPTECGENYHESVSADTAGHLDTAKNANAKPCNFSDMLYF